MKYLALFCIVAASLGGCAIVPYGYGDHHDGYYRDRNYGHGYGYGRDYDERGGPGGHYQGS